MTPTIKQCPGALGKENSSYYLKKKITVDVVSFLQFQIYSLFFNRRTSYKQATSLRKKRRHTTFDELLTMTEDFFFVQKKKFFQNRH